MMDSVRKVVLKSSVIRGTQSVSTALLFVCGFIAVFCLRLHCEAEWAVCRRGTNRRLVDDHSGVCTSLQGNAVQ